MSASIRPYPPVQTPLLPKLDIATEESFLCCFSRRIEYHPDDRLYLNEELIFMKLSSESDLRKRHCQQKFNRRFHQKLEDIFNSLYPSDASPSHLRPDLAKFTRYLCAKTKLSLDKIDSITFEEYLGLNGIFADLQRSKAVLARIQSPPFPTTESIEYQQPIPRIYIKEEI